MGGARCPADVAFDEHIANGDSSHQCSLSPVLLGKSQVDFHVVCLVLARMCSGLQHVLPLLGIKGDAGDKSISDTAKRFRNGLRPA